MKRLMLVLFIPWVYAYTPPVGIPNPSAYFSTFGEIDQASPSVATSGNARCPNWPSAASTNCYYVDKTHASATNSSNTNGYPNKPRATPPEGTLQAGALVYIHAGTYTAYDSAGQNLDWSGVGTPDNPIWIIGNPNDKPVIQDQIGIGWGFNTSYMIVENLNISGDDGASVLIRLLNDAIKIDHIIIRNCTIGPTEAYRLAGKGSPGSATKFTIGMSTASNESPNGSISHIVIYNNEVGYAGDKSGARDQSGIYNSYHTNYVWVLNNTVHDNDADGIAGSHYSNDTTMLTQNYFIGGNTIFGNGENCIDLKVVDHAVISENTCVNMATREGGWGIVLHYGQNSLPTKDSFVLFNTIYDAGGGVSCTYCSNLTVIGNVMHGIHASNGFSPTDPLSGAAVGFRATGGQINIIDNTFYDVDEGVRCGETLSAGDTLNIYGNIFSPRSDASRHDVRVDGGHAYADMDRNIFYPSGSIYWNGATRTLSYMQGQGECANCLEADPLFASASSNFHLLLGSPAIGANTEHSAYGAFYSAYGLNIRRDIDGVERSRWDIGAYQYATANAHVSRARLRRAN